MGAHHSTNSAGGSPAPSGSAVVAPFTASARENEEWSRIDVARILDDAYVTDAHKRNDLVPYLDKRRALLHSAATTSAASSAGSGASAPRSDSHSYESIHAYLGPHFTALQSHRFAAIVGEIDQQCSETASSRTAQMPAKREALIRRIHAALEARAQAAYTAGAATPSSALGTVAALPEYRQRIASHLSPIVTAQQQLDEIGEYSLSQQLSIRWLLSMLAALDSKATDAEPASSSAVTLAASSVSESTATTVSRAPLDPALTSFFLAQLLPLLDELTPMLVTESERSVNGVTDAIESFLLRVFREHGAAEAHAPSASATPFPLAQVTSSLLALALSRTRFSTILAVIQPILLARLTSASADEDDDNAEAHASPLECLAVQPQHLLARISTIVGPKVVSAKGARSGSCSGVSSAASASARPGALFVWGSSQNCGKLGLGSASYKKVPTALSEFDGSETTGIISVSAFQNHVLALDNQARVYGFGSNETGRIGLEESVASKSEPTLLSFFTGRRVVQVSVGNEFSAVLTGEGHVYTFGDGANLKLGTGTQASSKTPVMVMALSGVKITSIACGGFHTLAIAANHELYSFGKGSRGQLGNGGTADSNPTTIKIFSGVALKQVAAGWEHSLVLTAGGTAYSCGGGYDSKSVCGHGAEGADVKTPRMVAAFAGVKLSYVACGWDHSLFITAEGAVYACGDGSGGRLGCGDAADQPLPKRVRGFAHPSDPSQQATIVACDGGEAHSAFVSAEGAVWSTGTDGTNGAAIKLVPTKVECARPMRFVTCGGKCTFGIAGMPNAAVPTTSADEKAAATAAAAALAAIPAPAEETAAASGLFHLRRVRRA
jgi:alpha-tubulin suppressor-like RCC1 family protein